MAPLECIGTYRDIKELGRGRGIVFSWLDGGGGVGQPTSYSFTNRPGNELR